MATRPQLIRLTWRRVAPLLAWAGLVGCAPSEAELAPSPPRGSAQLVIDDEALYWIDRSLGGIQRHDRATGETTTLTPVAPEGGLTLASNGSALFWDDGGGAMGVRSLRLSDGQTRTLAFDAMATGAVAATEDSLLYAADDGGSFTLNSVGLEGGAPAVLAELDTPPLAITLGDDGLVYGVNCRFNGVWRVPAAGGPLEVLVPASECPRSLALDGDELVFHDVKFEREQLFEIERDGGARGNAASLRRIDGSAFTVRDGAVYLPSSGTMLRLGDETSPLGEAANVVGVAADDGIVYWLEQPALDGPIELRKATTEP